MSHTFDDFVPARYPGPVTNARQTKLKTLYLALAIAGFALALLGGTSGQQAFGLGMVFPGAGFLQYLGGGFFSTIAHLSLFVASVVAIAAAAFYGWMFTGNILAPVVVWFLTALGAGAMGHPHSFEGAPVLVFALVGGLAWAGHDATRKARQRCLESLKRRRAAFAEVTLSTPRSPIDPQTGLREVKELSLEDLQLLRYAYDRALQPIDEWNGFYTGFQSEWQLTGTRYQLAFLGWALSQTNFTALPAMRSYLQQAQLNLIEKFREPRAWNYWRWERLWGGLSWNPDPFPIHNVMYSGYLGKSLGLYRNVTGDRRYDEEGAFTLRDANGDEYAYDLPKICEVIGRQSDEADFGHIGCEPHFLYPLCNMFGNTAIAAQSASSAATPRFEGSGYWAERQAQYRQSHRDEFTSIDGTVLFGRSLVGGFPVGFPGILDSFNTVTQAAYLPSVLPEVAAFQLEIAKSDLFERKGSGYELRDLESITSLDPTTGEKGVGWTLAMLRVAAKEQGDEETAELAGKLIEEHLQAVVSGGVMHYPKEGLPVHAKLIMSRVATTNSQYDLVNQGSDERWLNGPLLTDATYPKVQVAKAVSDGTNLELVLYPENEPDTQEIELSQLKPDKQYRVTGSARNEQSVFADAQGKARLSVDLDGRTALRFEQEQV